MKRLSISILASVLCMLWSAAALAQNTNARVEGTVKDKAGAPLAGAQLVFNNKDNGQKLTLKTDKKGKYVAITIPPGSYDIDLVKDGQKLWTVNKVPIKYEGCCGGERDGVNRIDIDLQQEAARQETATPAEGAAAGGAGGAAGSQQQAAGTPAGGLSQGGSAPGAQPQPQKTVDPSKLTGEQKKQYEEAMAKRNAQIEENKKIGNVNQLMAQAHTQDAAKQYDEAVATMKQATEAGSPYPVVWANLGSYELDWAGAATDNDTRKQRAGQAGADLEKAIQMCSSDTTGKVQGCAAQQVASYHNNLAKALANSGDSKKALDEYETAAKLDPASAGQFYFNAGAVMTNEAQHQKTQDDRNKFIDSANQAFDKAIAANPNNAVPYCEKGKNLLNKATLDKSGKMVAPEGTSEALNKCIALNPPGTYGEEAKQLLAALGETVNTNYKATKKKQ